MSYSPQGSGMAAVLSRMAAVLTVAQTTLVAAQNTFAALQVPDPDNSSNEIINQLIGNRNDDDDTRTIFSNLNDVWEGEHHESKVWPELADAIIVTAHADSWVLGNYAEIAAANDISEKFHIHHLHIHAPSANGEYELVLYAATTEIARVTFTRTEKKDDIEGLDIIAPHCVANTQIQARLASSNNASADTLKLKFWYHEH